MQKWSLVACGLLALVSVARAETGDYTPRQNPLRFDCGQFEKLPNGYWRSGPNATVNGNVFANNIFGPRGFRLNGIDLAEALNKQCGGIR